ncbi:hypothetical protein WJR50_30085 [Catalinimonas sp. 4WD22]|uniref:hypothetical protein n=1 Tax=Catalinimonas locisalis TaxID=3133978 RepID=UPI0031019C1B
MKIFFYTLIVSVSFGLWICTSYAFAQVSVEWDKTLGGYGDEQLYNAIPASDGGYVLLGYSNIIDRYFSADVYWIHKIDTNLNYQWQIEFEDGKSYHDGVNTADGGLLLVGSSLLKVDKEGNIEWEKPIRAKHIIHSPEGGYLLTGESVIKIDEDGNKEWQRSWNAKNGIYCPGGGYLLAIENGSDYQILKTDEQGNHLWEKIVGGDGQDVLNDQISTTDGGYLLSGFSSSNTSGDKSENSKGGSDYWVVKIDEEGNKQWDKTLGGNSHEELKSIVSTSDGNYIVAGWSYSHASGDKSENSRGLTDYWIVEINEEGNILWDKTVGGNRDDLLVNIIVNPDGGYLLAGDSDSEASGEKSENNHKNEWAGFPTDVWLVKVQENISIKSFTLIDAETNEELQKINNGDVIDLATLSSTTYNIQAIPGSERVASIEFHLNGPFNHSQEENTPPFALFGDNPAGNFYGRFLPPGQYQLTATPYIDRTKQSSAGASLTIHFTIIHSEEIKNPQVTGFDLYNPVTDQKVMDLIDSTVIVVDEQALEAFTVLIHTLPDFVGSVKVELEGPLSLSRIENTKPYVLFRNNSNDLVGEVFRLGEYILKATPYTEPDAQGEAGEALEISFSVVEDENESVSFKIQWDKTFGGGLDDNLATSIPTGDGGYLLAGSTSSNASGDKSQNSRGGADYWIVKIDAQGNKQWDKTFGGEFNDYLSSAIPTEDGGYLLVGNSYSNASGDKSEENNTDCIEFSDCDFDYWIVKIDAQGNKQWDKTLGGNVAEEISDAIPTRDGGYLLAGHSISNISGDKSEDNKGGFDYWIVKIDAQGNKLWDKTIGRSSEEFLSSVVPTTDDGFILAGIYGSEAFHLDYWIVKIDAQGNILWDKTFGGSGEDRINDAISTADGGFLLAGNFLVKTDKDGNKQWEKPISAKIAINTLDGGYILGSGPDYTLTKIDAQGNKLWDKTLGGSSSQSISNVMQTEDGGYLLAGSSFSNASGDKSEDSRGGSDYWVVKIKETDATFSIQSFALVNAANNEELQTIHNGDNIDLAMLPTRILSIAALTDAVGSIAFHLQGPLNHKQTENFAPHVLFGDNPRGDVQGKLLPVGDYQLTATPYELRNKEGNIGPSLSIHFTLINTDSLEQSVTAFELYDATTDDSLMTLEQGSIVNLSEMNHHPLNILAHTHPEFVGSVKIELKGPLSHTQIENTQPYALFRNKGLDFFGRAFPAGNYYLKATPYSKAHAQGEEGTSLEIDFTLVEDESNARLSVYPVPTSGLVDIYYQGSIETAELSLQDISG